MTGPASPGRPADDLPVAVTSFVGRRHEITEIRRLISGSRLVTLTGAGGVGKTRLAIEVAGRAGRAFADGVRLVDLASVEDGAQVAQKVADTIGVIDRSARPPAEKVTEQLLRRQTLIILDNCEHLHDACAVFTDRLLRAVPGVRVLATSRRALGITGEQLFTVPPLSVPDPEHTGPTGGAAALGGYDAVRLLVERAAAVRPGFELTEDNHAAVARVCARLDGIPLAIELAATRLRVLSVEELADRLEDRFAVLTSGSRAALPRQQTLRALIDWSHALCSEQERLLWARLSVFSGGFDLAAAEGVCAGDPAEDGAGPAAGSIMDLVDRLVGQSILISEYRETGVWFRLLETIRQYGRERLAESGQEAALRRRHFGFYLARAERVAAEWCGPGQEKALARLRTDHGNLRAALEWSMSDPDGGAGPEPALRLTAALRQHWYADVYLAEGRSWLDRALALPGPPSPTRVTALWVAAWVTLLQGDVDIATRRLDECERLAERFGDRTSLAFATSLRGTAALFDSDLPTAISRFEAAVVALRASGNPQGGLTAMFQLAISLAHAGDTARAAETCRRALEISDECGERWTRSYVLWVLGFTTWQAGDPVAATEHTRAALAIQRGFSDHVGAALMIELLAWLAGARSDFPRAARLLGAAGSVWRKVGTTIGAFGPHLGVHHADCERATRRALRDAAYRAAIKGTRHLTVTDAIARALDEPAGRAGSAGPSGPPRGAAAAAAAGKAGPLTPREAEVAGLVARGLSNRRIAEALVLSPRTVDGHVEHILAKLGFTARTQIAAWVAERTAP